MPIPNEQRILEILAEYIKKSDRYFNKTKEMDKKLEKQNEKPDIQQKTILGILLNQNEAIKKQNEKFDMQDEAFKKNHEFLLKPSERMDVMLQLLIKHSESIEKAEDKLFGHDERIQKLESKLPIYILMSLQTSFLKSRHVTCCRTTDH